jgi:hypothetical protein
MSGKKKKNTSAVNNAEKNNDALKVNLHKVINKKICDKEREKIGLTQVVSRYL